MVYENEQVIFILKALDIIMLESGRYKIFKDNGKD